MEGEVGNEKMVRKAKGEGKETVEGLKRLNEEYVEHLQRLQAEFENYQKRVAKEQEKFSLAVHAHVLVKLLPVVEDFERAVQHLREAGVGEEHVQGVELVHRQFYKILEGEGVRSMLVVGERFDPYKHEVVQRMPSDCEEGIIVEEVQRGYFLRDQVLRPAKVMVSAGRKEEVRSEGMVQNMSMVSEHG